MPNSSASPRRVVILRVLRRTDGIRVLMTFKKPHPDRHQPLGKPTVPISAPSPY
jgi:hypothetical protein